MAITLWCKHPNKAFREVNFAERNQKSAEDRRKILSRMRESAARKNNAVPGRQP